MSYTISVHKIKSGVWRWSLTRWTPGSKYPSELARGSCQPQDGERGRDAVLRVLRDAVTELERRA